MALHGAFRDGSYLRLRLLHSLSTLQFCLHLAIISSPSFHTIRYIRRRMSISSHSSATPSIVLFTSSNMSPATQYATQRASIAALPSFTHSLSTLPRMTSVSSDMVYYGTLASTKQASEAKVRDRSMLTFDATEPCPIVASSFAECETKDQWHLVYFISMQRFHQASCSTLSKLTTSL
jgi:hypothetical protein